MKIDKILPSLRNAALKSGMGSKHAAVALINSKVITPVFYNTTVAHAEARVLQYILRAKGQHEEDQKGKAE